VARLRCSRPSPLSEESIDPEGADQSPSFSVLLIRFGNFSFAFFSLGSDLVFISESNRFLPVADTDTVRGSTYSV